MTGHHAQRPPRAAAQVLAPQPPDVDALRLQLTQLVLAHRIDAACALVADLPWTMPAHWDSASTAVVRAWQQRMGDG